MSVFAELPDGTKLEFPDGTAQDVIDRTVKQHLAPPVGAVEGTGRAIVQGGLFGFGDEAVAGGLAARQWLGNTFNAPETFGSVPGRAPGEVYDAALDRERSQLSSFRQSDPWLAYPAEIVGALPGAIATGGTSAGLPLGARALQGAGIAAAQGGVYGFGAGEGGVPQRLGSAALSAGVAAPIGAAAPLIGAGVRNLAGKFFTGQAASNVGTTTPAMNTLLRAGAADGALGGRGAQNIAAAGPDAMLADAGPSMQGILDTAIQRSGAAGVVGREAVEGRATQAGQNLTQALDNAFGQPAGIRSTETALRTGTAGARNDAYQAAYAQPIDYTSEIGRQIEDIVSSRVPDEAIAAANRLMRAELGRGSQQIMADIAEDGTVTFRSMPDVQQLDYITRGLNEVADAANGQGKLGGTTQIGRVYGNLSREIRDLMRKAVPEYATALQTAAEPIRARNALQFGVDIFKKNVTRDEVAETVGNMTDAERTFVAQGIRSQMDEALANVRRTVQDGNMDAKEAIQALRDLSSRAAREKIGLVIGDAKAAQLFSDLDRATMSLDLRAAVATNSKTFARTATDEGVRAQTEDGAINALRSGEPVNMLKRIIQSLGGRTADDKARISDETYSAMVELLTGPRGQDAINALLRLQNAQQMLNPRTPVAGLLGEMATGAPAAPFGAAGGGLLSQ